MQFTQPVITDEQALLVRVALDTILSDPERVVMEDEERAEYERLAVFFGQVASSPATFPVTGQMATRVRGIVRRAKGAAQPPRKNKRKARQEARQSFAKRRRKDRRELTATYNEAVARTETERVEMDEIHAARMAEIEAQPKFDVISLDGQTIMSGVPESFIRPSPHPGYEGERPGELKIELPATAEKALERDNLAHRDPKHRGIQPS